MIERTRFEDITVLTLCHGKASALDLEFLQAATEAFESEHRSESRAVIVTGRGKIFSAGVDLRRVLEGRSYLEKFLPALDRFMWALSDLEKPLIAAINGHAIAGGCVMACAADRRLFVQTQATIGAPELVVGVPFPPSAFEALRVALPSDVLREVVLTGGVYDPQQALAKGLVDELVEPAELMARAKHWAQHFATMPSEAFRMTKRQLWAPSRERSRAAVSASMLAAWSSKPVQANIAAYVDRTLGK